MVRAIACVILVLLAGCRREMVVFDTPKAYSDQTKAFLHWFRQNDPNEPARSTFILADTVTTEFVAMKYSMHQCLEDSADLTAAEREQIAAGFKHPRIHIWTKDWVSDARIVQLADIYDVFSASGGGWEAFYQKYGPSYSDYSLPIFLRGNTLCLFYSGTHCGGLCGYGALVLYRRDGDAWKVLETYGYWVS